MLRRASDVCKCRDYTVGDAVVRITGSLPSGKKFATGSCQGLDRFSRAVYEDLYEALCVEFPVLLDDPDPLVVQRILHEAVVTSRTIYFFGRVDILKTLERFCLDSGQRSLVVWGDPGCGKSALIAKFYSRMKLKVGEEISYSSFVWIHIVSATP